MIRMYLTTTRTAAKPVPPQPTRPKASHASRMGHLTTLAIQVAAMHKQVTEALKKK